MASTESNERTGVVTFKGNPVTLVGPELKVGDPIPEFHVVTSDQRSVGFSELSDHGRKAVLFILVPSIDTSVCSLETGKFNRHVAGLPADKIKVVTVSVDTTFAQKRWAAQEHIDNIELLSDHRDRAFGDAFGARMKELGLLSRSIYLADKDGIVRYIQTVPEVATEPDYDAVLNAAREIVGN